MDPKTYTNQQPTAKKSIPWVIGVVHVIRIQEYGPLVSGDLELTTAELVLDSMEIPSQSIE